MTDLQINFIRAFGDKELEFGCLFKYPNQWDDDILTVCSLYDDTGNSKTLSFLPPDKESTWEINYFTEDTTIEILGSEPHLFPDVAKKLREEGWELELGSIGGEYHILVHERGIQEAIIYFNPYIPLLEQPQVMEQLLSLTK